MLFPSFLSLPILSTQVLIKTNRNIYLFLCVCDFFFCLKLFSSLGCCAVACLVLPFSMKGIMLPWKKVVTGWFNV